MTPDPLAALRDFVRREALAQGYVLVKRLDIEEALQYAGCSRLASDKLRAILAAIQEQE